MFIWPEVSSASDYFNLSWKPHWHHLKVDELAFFFWIFGKVQRFIDCLLCAWCTLAKSESLCIIFERLKNVVMWVVAWAFKHAWISFFLCSSFIKWKKKICISNTMHEMVNSVRKLFNYQTDKREENPTSQKDQKWNEFLNRYSRKLVIITFPFSILVKIPCDMKHMPRCSDLWIKFIEKWQKFWFLRKSKWHVIQSGRKPNKLDFTRICQLSCISKNWWSGSKDCLVSWFCQ